MSFSVKGYHRKPTYYELIQEAVINPTETIKYPNRIATQLRNTPQLTRFDDESFLDMSTINSNAAKQNIQQTAVQRAMQPVARPIPTGLEQFDMAAGEKEAAYEAPSYTLQKVRQRESDAKRARLAGIGEDAVYTPDKTDAMMATSSAAASSSGYGGAAASASGYGDGDSAALVPVRVRTQEFEERATGNLRGTGNLRAPRYDSSRATQHRRSDSGASTESATSAVSAVSTATTVAIPAQVQPKMDLETLIKAAKHFRTILNDRDEIEDSKLSGEITTNILIIETMRSNDKYKTYLGGVAFKNAKKRLIEIVETTPL